MALFVVKRNPKRRGKSLKVILGKSVAKRAVLRNLLKRRIRAVMQPIISESDADFVIIVRPGAADLSYEELRKELVREVEAKQ
jgi:ribonuclease P protein component